MGGAAFLLTVALAASQAAAAKSPGHSCPAGWDWDGSHCYTQARVAPDPLRDLAWRAELARAEAAVAYWEAMRRAYEDDRFPYSYGRGRRR